MSSPTPNRVDPSHADSNRAHSNRPHSNRADTDPADPNHATTFHAGPPRTEGEADREPPKAPVAALTGLALLGGIGGWLTAAPFTLGDQVRAAAWTTPTRVDVATGAILLVVALAGLLGYLGAAIGWTARYGQQVMNTRR